MKIRFFLLAAVLGISAVNAQNYKLVWEDNFDGSTLDSSKWNVEQKVGIWNTGSNAEMQHYTKDNVSVADDGEGNNCLVLTAKKEDYNGYGFTSGKVTTKGKFAFTKGKLEAFIKIPDLANGLWPAFWTLGYTPAGWPDCGEIDILEMGHAQGITEGVQNSYIGAHLFWGPYDGGYPNYGTEYTANEDLSTGYFKHTVVWTESTISVYFNENTDPYFVMGISGDEFNEFKDFQHYILFNLAVGGSFTGIHNANDITAPIPASMYVDWVKVYQEEGSEDFESNLEIYGDFGIYEEKSSVDMRMDLGFDLSENITGLTPLLGTTPYEGDNVLSFNTISGQAFEAKLISGLTRNMSSYSSGSVQFNIKTDIATDIQIGLADTTGAEKFITFNADNENNFLRDGNWQMSYINLADFANDIDLSALKGMFIIKGSSDADNLLAIDNVLFKESVPAKGYYFLFANNPNITDGFVIDNGGNNLFPWENTVEFNKYYPAYEGENVLSFKSQGNNGWFGFGLHAANTLNFSAYVNGYLNISMRSESTESFSIGMESDGNISEVTFNGSNDPYEFERNGEWQHLNIPMSDLSGLNLSNVLIVFLSRGGSIGNIAFDNIYLSEELPTLDNPSICYTSALEVKPNSKTIKTGIEQTFVVEAANQYGNAHDNYPTWSADGGSIDENGIFSSDETGEFTITAVQDGVSATASIQVELASSIKNLNNPALQMYLSNKTAELHINGMLTKSAISVYNSTAALIGIYNTNQEEFVIDMKDEATGVYIVRVVSKEGIQTLKIVKQ
ncbi:MAG: T9SS type A sorting domain-containing protein [Salinivirgaceae bacterium]|jgi:beta-glucanase (GH16 family)|nr:T9SS type A sorting domain-containing protein [Salinivirgaceae bacterium]